MTLTICVEKFPPWLSNVTFLLPSSPQLIDHTMSVLFTTCKHNKLCNFEPYSKGNGPFNQDDSIRNQGQESRKTRQWDQRHFTQCPDGLRSNWAKKDFFCWFLSSFFYFVSGQPSYPKFKKCREKFQRECAEAKKSGEYTKMVHFYGTAFQNFVNLNAVFKVSCKVVAKTQKCAERNSYFFLLP